MEPMQVGVIGCGNISSVYLDMTRRFDVLRVAAVADLEIERARQQAEQFDVPAAMGVKELLQRGDIEIVLNLTVPAAHAKVSLAALSAGKHVYSEKPLAVTRAEGRRILERADKLGLRVGCAPDTVLGGAHQTARKLLDEGAIGRPVAATAFMTCPGHEGWHPDPAFYYQPGGGPMMDMGPYYLSVLTMLLGPIVRVCGSAETLIDPRIIGSQPKFGQTIDVQTPDHVTGNMVFDCGAVGTIVTSFCVYRANLPWIEIYGTEGSMSLADPNWFGGAVRLIRRGEQDWQNVPLSHGYTDNFRSLGLADMARAIRVARPHRATGQQAYHVLDVMHGFLDSARRGRHVRVGSTFERPAPLPPGLRDGELD